MEKKKKLAGSLFVFFMSMRFSLFILGLIAVGSTLGSFIKQGGTEEEYLATYTVNTYKIIKTLGLDDTYHSIWFYILIALFTINLFLCTTQQFRRLIGERRRYKPQSAEKLKKMELSTYIPEEQKEEVIKGIRSAYRPVYRDEKETVFERGVLSRWGAFITHGSIIIIIAGALIGFVFGYRGYVVLAVGETKDHMEIEGAGDEQKTLGFAIKCSDFKASFYPDGTPKDYVSNVEILEDGRTVVKKEIRVNSPLFYKGIRIYQSGYGKRMSFEFRVDDKKMVLAEQETLKKGNLMMRIVRFVREVHNFGPGVQIVYPEGQEVKTTWFMPNVDRLRSQVIQGVRIKIDDIREEPYTNLEISRNPGLPLVWAGFIMILFGLWVTFFTSYRRILIVSTGSETIITGYASKNKELFKKEFERLKKR